MVARAEPPGIAWTSINRPDPPTTRRLGQSMDSYTNQTYDEIMSATSAARRFGVSVVWLANEARQGRLPHLNADGKLLFSELALKRALLALASGHDLQEVADA